MTITWPRVGIVVATIGAAAFAQASALGGVGAFFLGLGWSWCGLMIGEAIERHISSRRQR